MVWLDLSLTDHAVELFSLAHKKIFLRRLTHLCLRYTSSISNNKMKQKWSSEISTANAHWMRILYGQKQKIY